MTQPERAFTADDWLHERRRKMSEPREPIDFEAERLKRLQERSKETRDP